MLSPLQSALRAFTTVAPLEKLQQLRYAAPQQSHSFSFLLSRLYASASFMSFFLFFQLSFFHFLKAAVCWCCCCTCLHICRSRGSLSAAASLRNSRRHFYSFSSCAVSKRSKGKMRRQRWAQTWRRRARWWRGVVRNYKRCHGTLRRVAWVQAAVRRKFEHPSLASSVEGHMKEISFWAARCRCLYVCVCMCVVAALMRHCAWNGGLCCKQLKMAFWDVLWRTTFHSQPTDAVLLQSAKCKCAALCHS